MSSIRRKIGISKPQCSVSTTAALSENHSPLQNLDNAPSMHAISNGAGGGSLHPVPHSLSVLHSLDPEADLPTRPTGRSLPNAPVVDGANILEDLRHVTLGHSDVRGSSDLPRRSSPQNDYTLSLQGKTNFQHCNNTSPFYTPQPFALTTPPVFPVCSQSTPVRTPETDAGETKSLNKEEQHQFLECAIAETSLANVSEAAPANSQASDAFSSKNSDSMLFELEGSAYRTEPSANESYTTPFFVAIGGRPIRPHARLASVEEDESADDLEDEIGEDSPYYRPKTPQKHIPKRRSSRHVRDSGNGPDVDMPHSTSHLSALHQVSPLAFTMSSRSSSVFANKNSSSSNEERRHSHEMSLPSADERRRHMTDGTSDCQFTSSESRELLNYLPESPRMGRRRSGTVPPAYPIQMPPALSNGLGVAVLPPSSPTFNQLWARHPNAQSYSVPPTPTHDPNEDELDNVFFETALDGVRGGAEGRTSAPPLGQPQSRPSSASKETASYPHSQDQLRNEVSSECDLASSMKSSADLMDSSCSWTSSFRLPRYFSFNEKHTGSSNPTPLPQRKQRHVSLLLPIDKNQLKKEDA